jgi:hypothetical protein
MAYDPEKQMLREFFLLNAPRTLCRFCHKPIYPPELTQNLTFGHRRQTKIHFANFTVHHEDENRENNQDSNLKNSHSNCHKVYHIKLRREENNHGRKEENERQEKTQEVTTAPKG